MSLDPPTYLFSLQNNIRQRPIPWPGAVRAGHITGADLRKIQSVDKVRKEQRRQTVEGDLEGFRTLLLGGNSSKSVLESAGKRADIVQYILVLAGDLIEGQYLQILPDQEKVNLQVNIINSNSQTFQHYPQPFSSTLDHISHSYPYSASHQIPRILYHFLLRRSLPILYPMR